MKRLQRQYMYFCTSKASELPLLFKVDACEDEQEVKRAEDFEEKWQFTCFTGTNVQILTLQASRK